MSYRSRWRRNKGRRVEAFSLLEMLITLGLFSALLTLVGQLSAGAFRFQASSVAHQDGVRQGALVCDLWARDLRHCEAIVWPKYSDWAKGRVYKFPTGRDAVVVYRLRQGEAATSVLVGYRFWVKTGKLERCVFRSNQTLTKAALMREDAPQMRKAFLPVVSGVSIWSCSQDQCGGQAVLGFSFLAQSAEVAQRKGSAQTNSGVQFSSEVQAKGL